MIASENKQNKTLKRRERKKKAKERRAIEREKLNDLTEENVDDVVIPSKLSNIEEFELRGGFSRFINHFESDTEEESTDTNQEFKVQNIIPSDDNRTLSELPLKARAAAILQEDIEKDDQEEPKMGKKKLKQLNRISTAHLKLKVERPELVETWDYCSPDPLLLLELKALRNTVPCPRHWCSKRKYLQGKRGIEKPAFQLPDYIAKTGIMEMRQTIQDKDADKTLKAKMREKIRPNVGKVDIDYKKFYDAFFKEQTKPPLSIHGDIYYEGKEFEVRLKEKKPGQLSEDLRHALGLPVGQNSEKFPPPWLIAMQRYGPPPSYPNLKIPGLNAPIPYGCLFGYQANGWGKPPVDEMGRPIYGDVFMDNLPVPPPPSDDGTTMYDEHGNAILQDDLQTKIWGDIDSDDESDDDEDDEHKNVHGAASDDDDGMSMDEDDAVDDSHSTGLITPAVGGLVTPSGFSTLGVGGTTSLGGLHSIDLRKQSFSETSGSSSSILPPPPPPLPDSEQRPLYQVLQEVSTQDQVTNKTMLMPTTKIYQIPGAGASSNKTPSSASNPTGASSAGVKTEETEFKPSKKPKEFKF